MRMQFGWRPAGREMEQQRADHRVGERRQDPRLKNGTATITACSVADSTKCTKISVTVTGAPADTKNTTTFYLNADGYTASNKAKLYYTFDGSTWTSAAMESTENCSGWVSVTIDNAGLKAATYLFYKGDSPSSATGWYHSGSANGQTNFSLPAEQSAVRVQNYAAVNGAPTGCSTGGGSSTTGSVTISGSTYEVGLNKTITLTATPTPSSDTVTWYSGNTSVAGVTAGPSTTTTVTGLKTGTTTITAKTSSGATASVTITVRDDSTINVYFQKSTVNWEEYYLHYQPKTGTNWPAVPMTDAGDCSGYVVASIPKANVAANHGYYFRNGNSPNSDGWYNSNGQNAEGDPFKFWSGTYTDMYVNTNSDKQPTKPKSCQFASSAAKVRARVSTAVLKSSKTDVIAVNDAEGSGTSAAPIVYSCGDAKGKCDMDTKAGYFKVVDLADGTYTLTETVAPNGYSIAGPYTVTITTTNGVTSVSITNATGGSIANNKILNIRNTGTISWNKVSSDSNNDKKLSGSEWKLTKTKNFGWNATTGKAEYATSLLISRSRLRSPTACLPKTRLRRRPLVPRRQALRKASRTTSTLLPASSSWKAWIGAGTRWSKPRLLTDTTSIPPSARSRSARSLVLTAPASGIRTVLRLPPAIRLAHSQLPTRITIPPSSPSRLATSRTSRV